MIYSHSQRRKNKYGNVKTIYRGAKYDSKKEAIFAMQLDSRLERGEIKKWKRQERITLEAYGEKICVYVLDFIITHNNGRKEFVEIKGRRTPVFNLKWKMFKAMCKIKYPKASLIIL